MGVAELRLFDSEEVKKYSGMAGCDMQDKECPVCGHPQGWFCRLELAPYQK